MSPIDRFTPEGLHRLRHGPEGLLTSFRDYATVPNAIVEIARATATAATTTTVEAVPSSHWASVSAVIAAIMATRTAKLTSVLVHLSMIFSPERIRFVHHLCRDHTRSYESG